MTEPLLSDRLRAALKHLVRLCAERSRLETELETLVQTRQQSIAREFQQAQKKIEQQLAGTQAAAVKEYQEKTQTLTSIQEAETNARQREYSALRLKINTHFETDRDRMEAEFKDTRWTITTVYEADRKVARDQLLSVQRQIGTAIQRIDACHEQAVQFGKKWQLVELCKEIEPEEVEVGDHIDALGGVKERLAHADSCLEQLKHERIPHFINGVRLPVLFVLGWLLLQLPALWMSEWYLWVGVSLLAVATIFFVVRAWLQATLKSNFVRNYRAIKQAGSDATVLQKQCLEEATQTYHDVVDQARLRQDKNLEKATETYRQALQQRQHKHEQDLTAADGRYQPLLEQIGQQRDKELRQAEVKYQRLMAASTLRYDTDLGEVTDKKKTASATLKGEQQTLWQALWQQWESGIVGFLNETESVRQRCAQLFPSWGDPSWETWPSAPRVPPGLPVGTFEVRLDLIPHGIPRTEKLRELVPGTQVLPALLPFPTRGSLLLKASEEGRAVGIQALQALMLRSLTALPPAKVRFTIFDPVGLGENFAAFTHLADHDDALISGKIWTEAPQIEQQLVNLTEHIENVIQKYLRNQFQTLEEYNAEAGEVAEPYRFLVVAHFPTNFTEEAARRLLSIAASGARCGIQTLVLLDMRQPLPLNFDIRDLEQVSTVLDWKDGRFVWVDPELKKYPLTLALPPDAEFITRVLGTVGERAVAASRVEVPFRVVAPTPDQWWTGDSRSGIRVALGRAGATRKQYLALGEGTAQHTLIAGKTGSGKSTLLHALITQLALYYSPDEVELYLVDFKKGVEFKSYATQELPHARVIAIESEREFGLSVLQRLDGELKLRGDLFRQLGAHDLAGARNALFGEPAALAAGSLHHPAANAAGSPHHPAANAAGSPVKGHPRLPRVLLIVDEFQEFFVEDDKIAQECALLLDRLVRQGRAFGIHILLGSQTLGGAYSLARSTIDQMAVRIALQCSEADGHLILGKDNPGARLLARPGEAIYNDANGLVEANSLFQTVWLSESTREEALGEVRELARKHGSPPPNQIVFEGNAAAQLPKNHLLQQILDAPTPPAVSAPAFAWLGEAIAIKDPTAAVFRRRGGSNLLMVGQHGEAALALLTSSVLSLAAALPGEPAALAARFTPHPAANAAGSPHPTRFYLLADPSGDEAAQRWFARLADLLPCVRGVGWRDLPQTLADIATEVERRTQERNADGPPVYLCIHALQGFRDLRRQDDDFGYSRKSDGPVHPSKHFATIYRDGPPVGVFVLLWCDTLTNTQRFLDRQALREFEMRVLFQMSAGDSSNLIDSPAASKLGLYRALYHAEDEGRTEKFRPYGLPPEEWLESLRSRLARMPVVAASERATS